MEGGSIKNCEFSKRSVTEIPTSLLTTFANKAHRALTMSTVVKVHHYTTITAGKGRTRCG